MADTTLRRWQTRDGGQQAAQAAALLELEDRLLRAMETARDLANTTGAPRDYGILMGLEQAVRVARILRREELRTDTPNGEVPGLDPATLARMWAGDLQAEAAADLAAGRITGPDYLAATRRAGLLEG